MRILMVHNRYLWRGGEDVSTETETALLRDAGHDVVLMDESNERIAEIGTVSTAIRSVWSIPARRRVDAVLADGGFDVMHVQNFFPLVSPSVYGTARRRGVAVVQALRNFRLLCPAASPYRDGAICEDCFGRAFAWPGVWHACYRDSRAATTAVATMSATHALLGTFRRDVDVFITPSQFAKSKFTATGWDPSSIEVVPNSVHPDPGVGTGNGGFALFVGRLESVKGIEVLLQAWMRSSVDLRLVVAGDGPLMQLVHADAAVDPRIEIIGPRPLAETMQLMRAARFVVVPSIWYETFGRVVAESLACGTPVIVSDLGALPELVEDGVDGIVVPPGDVDALRTAVEELAGRDDMAPMRATARAAYETRHAADANLARLLSIYELARSRMAATIA